MAKKASKQKRKPYQVFVSHATSDKWLAKTLCEKLEGAGAATFRDDRDIEAGDDIADEIRRQINASQEMVVLWTPDSVKRPWVLLEIGAAWGKGERMRITLVLCHMPTDPLPGTMKFKKAVSINELDTFVEELAARVSEYYGHG